MQKNIHTYMHTYIQTYIHADSTITCLRKAWAGGTLGTGRSLATRLHVNILSRPHLKQKGAAATRRAALADWHASNCLNVHSPVPGFDMRLYIVCLPVCLSACLSVCLSVCVSPLVCVHVGLDGFAYQYAHNAMDQTLFCLTFAAASPPPPSGGTLGTGRSLATRLHVIILSRPHQKQKGAAGHARHAGHARDWVASP